MQRVRIGLTGLGFVFLAVLLAAIFAGQSADEAPITPNSVEVSPVGTPPPAPPAAPAAQPTEPLAQLGVAPGNADSNSATPPPAGAAAPLQR